jgi:hypothetical protein
LITATFGAVGKQFSESPRTDAQIAAYADAMADMFCAYLQSLPPARPKAAAKPAAKSRPEAKPKPRPNAKAKSEAKTRRPSPA